MLNRLLEVWEVFKQYLGNRKSEVDLSLSWLSSIDSSSLGPSATVLIVVYVLEAVTFCGCEDANTQWIFSSCHCEVLMVTDYYLFPIFRKMGDICFYYMMPCQEHMVKSSNFTWCTKVASIPKISTACSTYIKNQENYYFNDFFQMY